MKASMRVLLRADKNTTGVAIWCEADWSAGTSPAMTKKNVARAV